MPQRSMIIQLVNENESAEALDRQTRMLAGEFRQIEGVTADLPEHPAPPGSRGDPITVGTIALAFVTGGGVTAIVQALADWLKTGRNRKVVLKVSIDHNSFEAEFPSGGLTQEELIKFTERIGRLLSDTKKNKR